MGDVSPSGCSSQGTGICGIIDCCNFGSFCPMLYCFIVSVFGLEFTVLHLRPQPRNAPEAPCIDLTSWSLTVWVMQHNSINITYNSIKILLFFTEYKYIRVPDLTIALLIYLLLCFGRASLQRMYPPCLWIDCANILGTYLWKNLLKAFSQAFHHLILSWNAVASVWWYCWQE